MPTRETELIKARVKETEMEETEKMERNIEENNENLKDSLDNTKTKH